MSEKKRGRPSKFNSELSELIMRLAAEGKTNAQMAEIIGISTRTFEVWCQKRPDFRRSLKEHKQLADELVEASLFRKAIGYTQQVEKLIPVKGVGVVREMVEESLPPDATAAIFWLKNRQPGEWRDKSEVEISSPLSDKLRKARDRKK